MTEPMLKLFNATPGRFSSGGNYDRLKKVKELVYLNIPYVEVEQTMIHQGPVDFGEGSTVHRAKVRIAEYKAEAERFDDAVGLAESQTKWGIRYRWDYSKKFSRWVPWQWRVFGFTYYPSEYSDYNCIDPRKCWKWAAEVAVAHLDYTGADFISLAWKDTIDPSRYQWGSYPEQVPPWTFSEFVESWQSFLQELFVQSKSPGIERVVAYPDTHPIAEGLALTRGVGA